MKFIGICFFVLFSSASWSTEIYVGSVSLLVPNPSGFSEVTPAMEGLYEVQKHFVAPSNVEYVAFIPKEDVRVALDGEIPDLPRRFTVQTSKSIEGLTISSSQFKEIKETVKSQNNQIIKKIESKLPGIMDKMNQGLKSDYNVDLALSISSMIPMPVHEESERTLSYTSLVKYDLKDENGAPMKYVTAVTATFVHVKSKVLFLYSYAEESGVEWSRNASRTWAIDIVQGNPSEFRDSVNETLPSSVSQINWDKVGSKAALGLISGAFFGAIFGLISWIKRKKGVS